MIESNPLWLGLRALFSHPSTRPNVPVCLWYRLLCLIFAGVITTCGHKDDVISERIFTFGTLVDVSISGKSAADARGIFEELQHDFDRLNAELNPWGGGELGRINEQLAHSTAINVSPSITQVITQSRDLSRQCNGLFNPAIGQLIKLWGFDTDPTEIKNLPQKNEISRLVQLAPSMEDIEIQESTILSHNPAVQLDFGAFAKGYAIDLAIEKITGLGVHNAIINAGGDLRAIGKHGLRAWRIGIRDPRANQILAAIEIKDDESVFTSGDYERYFMHDGRRYHHILDPMSGYPMQHTISVTVIHSIASVADAASTALFVAGPDRWHDIAQQMGIAYVMLIDRQGTVHMNPKMAQRIVFKVTPAPTTKLSEPL